MKQVLQDLRTGATEVADVACPAAGRGQLLIRTRRSLVSAGTERMLVDFGKAGWIEKARQQPDKVRMVIDKIRTDGLLPTVQAVRNKLDQQLPMGYCNVGEVVAVGEGVSGFEISDRVASNGRHAEMVAVPVNLCARIPAAVSDEDAAFTVLGAIALQGIRLVQPTLGEAIVVTGLGLIGLITVQLLRAHGCRVLGIDFDPARLELARRFGAEVVDLQAGEDAVVAAQRFSRGRGVDATLITAATRSSEPVHQAALMCRKRGRIVLVGVTGLELSRADFYEKELTFQVSCSYGPGRYDAAYEEQGRDYPIGFVRWTEQRNFEAVIDMLAEGRLHVQPLVSHRFTIEEAVKAYEVVAGSEPSLGILLEYPDPSQVHMPRAFAQRTVDLPASGASQRGGGVAFLGAGNYAGSMLIPAFKATGVRLRTIVSAGGVSSLHAGRKFGFERASTDPAAALEDAQTDIAVISTRHDTHASLVLAALAAGKHVFTEKPLCLSLDDLNRIEAAAAGSQRLLMVGFNRRFAPHVRRMKALLAAVPGPKSLVMTVNAGVVPMSHWTQDPQVGGGRLVGEGCHFIDLLRFLVDAPVIGRTQVAMAGTSADSAAVTLTFADGSVGSLHYLSNGNKSFPKERLQVFAAGRVLELDNFRRLSAFGWDDFRSHQLWRQDKGQRACIQAFVDAVRTDGASPIPLAEIIEVSRLSIEIQQALGRSSAG
jgi:Predicted dehydrogenases and related proteins